jgi:hypothetical protein
VALLFLYNANQASIKIQLDKHPAKFVLLVHIAQQVAFQLMNLVRLVLPTPTVPKAQSCHLNALSELTYKIKELAHYALLVNIVTQLTITRRMA